MEESPLPFDLIVMKGFQPHIMHAFTVATILNFFIQRSSQGFMKLALDSPLHACQGIQNNLC